MHVLPYRKLNVDITVQQNFFSYNVDWIGWCKRVQLARKIKLNGESCFCHLGMANDIADRAIFTEGWIKMDKVTGNKAVIASGANFKGQIKNAPAIEINGTVEADIKAEKLTIGDGGKFVGTSSAELVVISGRYDGNMDAGSIWATATAEISGKIQYKTIQLDRGAALNCRFIHNWKQEKTNSKKTDDLVTKKGSLKKGNTNMKSLKVGDEKPGLDRTKKRNAELSERAETAGARPKSVLNYIDEKKENDDSDFRLLADWSKKVSAEDKKLRGRRLGIFKFGSRAAKLPDAQS